MMQLRLAASRFLSKRGNVTHQTEFLAEMEEGALHDMLLLWQLAGSSAFDK